MESIDRTKKYRKINEVFNDYLLEMEDTFFYDYLDYFLELAVQVRQIISDSNQSFQADYSVYKLLNPEYGKLSEHLSLEETLQIVEEYLQTYLPQYKDAFTSCLNNGIINIAIDLDAEDQDTRNHAGYKFQDHYFVNVALNHNYQDPKLLIHEFIHYLNCPKNKATPSRDLLTETISIFFECDILRFMQEKGYNKNEIAKVFYSRIEECYKLCCSLPIDLSLLNTFKYTGNLSDQSFEDAKSFQLFRRKTKIDYLEDVDEVYEKLEQNESLDTSVGYMIGTIIAFSSLVQDSSKTREKFVMLNESVNSKEEAECLEILGINFKESDSIINVLENFQTTIEGVTEVLSQEKSHNKNI